MSGKRQRGRPFSQTLDHDFIESAVALLMEKGSFDAVSVDAVCARIGASKASFYRRWPDRDRFILAIMGSLRSPSLPLGPPTASLRDDLVAILGSMFGPDPERTRVVHSALVTEGRKNRSLMELFFRDIVAPRRKALLDRLRLAVTRGELSGDIDVSVFYEMLTAPVLKLILLYYPEQPVPHRFVERLVDQALRGGRS